MKNAMILILFAGILSCSEERSADVPVTLVSPTPYSTNTLPVTLIGTLSYTPQIRPYFSDVPTADFSVSNIQVVLIYNGTNGLGKSLTISNKVAASGSGGGFSVVLQTNLTLSNIVLPTRVDFLFVAPVDGREIRFYPNGTFDESYLILTTN